MAASSAGSTRRKVESAGAPFTRAGKGLVGDLTFVGRDQRGRVGPRGRRGGALSAERRGEGLVGGVASM